MNGTATNRVREEPGGHGVVAHVGLHALGSLADSLGFESALSSRFEYSVIATLKTEFYDACGRRRGALDSRLARASRIATTVDADTPHSARSHPSTLKCNT